eukprot:3554983-Pleurochrysis_carterae.AAC.2
MLSRSVTCGGCTKCRSGSGTATRFLRSVLGEYARRLSRRYGAPGRWRPPPMGCSVEVCRAGVGAYSVALAASAEGNSHLNDLSQMASHLLPKRTAHLEGRDREIWFGGRGYQQANNDLEAYLRSPNWQAILRACSTLNVPRGTLRKKGKREETSAASTPHPARRCRPSGCRRLRRRRPGTCCMQVLKEKRQVKKLKWLAAWEDQKRARRKLLSQSRAAKRRTTKSTRSTPAERADQLNFRTASRHRRAGAGLNSPKDLGPTIDQQVAGRSIEDRSRRNLEDFCRGRRCQAPWDLRDARESEGARRHWRCVRERFCGDGEYASDRQTSKTSSSLLDIYECFIPAAARPVFRSPRSPPRCSPPPLRLR